MASCRFFCLTEIQITPDQSTQIPEQHLGQLQFLYNKSEDKSQSITVAYSDTSNIVSYNEMLGRSYLLLRKSTFMDFWFWSLVLHHKNGEKLNWI